MVRLTPTAYATLLSVGPGILYTRHALRERVVVALSENVRGDVVDGDGRS